MIGSQRTNGYHMDKHNILFILDKLQDDVCNAEFVATIEDDMKKVASTDFSIAAPYMNKLKPIGMLEIFYKSGVKDRS